MAHTHAIHDASDDKLELGARARLPFWVAFLVGILGLVTVACYAPMVLADIPRAWSAYLMAFAFFLSLAVGGTFFTLLHYVTRAGWSVSVRRVPEALAKMMPVMLVLSVPILYSIYKNDGDLYRWAMPSRAETARETEGAPRAAGERGPSGAVAASAEGTVRVTGEATPPPQAVVGVSQRPKTYENITVSPLEHGLPDDELVAGKKESRLLLDSHVVIVRDLVALGLLSCVAWWYTARSRKQDVTGDPELTRPLNVRAAPLLVVFGLSVTMLAFDLLMSLDPVWISTLFGGYFFAGSAVAVFAATVLVLQILQSCGYLRHSIRRDHYHDLSKWQFAFTFFWGYLAFAQFMLLWYSSQPEELSWLARRGASTAKLHLETSGGWTIVSLCLLFGHLLIPFGGLLSRHVKRAPAGRIFWACWILVFHLLDIYWIVMPECRSRPLGGQLFFGIPEIGALLGVGGIFVAFLIYNLSTAALRPLKDPRASESLTFQQAF